MSTLSKITIKEVTGNTVRCRYEIIHPDNHDIPESPVFAFQIITELYRKILEGYLYNSNDQEFPYNQAEAEILFKKHPAKAKLDQWSLMLTGAQVTITEAEYRELERLMTEDYDNYPKNISGYGMYNGVYHKNHRADYAGCCDVAEEEITGVRVENEKNFPWNYTLLDNTDNLTNEEWDELYSEANRPQCDLLFTVKDKNVLFHVWPGCVWESAMFDLQYA